jgi:hypothetical protein
MTKEICYPPKNPKAVCQLCGDKYLTCSGIYDDECNQRKILDCEKDDKCQILEDSKNKKQCRSKYYKFCPEKLLKL